MLKYKLLLLVLFLLILSACTNADYALINNTKIKLIRIATTNFEHYQGLSFRESLCQDCGMLFAFDDNGTKNFVMRNMNFPLDIIFIKNDKIINIHKNVKPEGESPKNIYSSEGPANSVLEVNSGFSDNNNIKIGDEVIFYISSSHE